MNTFEAGGQATKYEWLNETEIAALELLNELPHVSPEIKQEIIDIFNNFNRRDNTDTNLFPIAGVIYKKNPAIFKADTLMKQGHELGKSVSIAALNLSDEDIVLLEWYQQLRAR